MIIFAFVSFALGDRSEKILVQFMLKSVLYFLLEFLYNPYLHSDLYPILSLLLYLVLRDIILSLFFYKQWSSFCSIIYWRGFFFFSIVYSCLLYHRLIDQKCLSLFLFCFIDLCVCFYANIIWIYYSFVVESKVRGCESSSCVLLSWDYFGYLGSFVFHSNFGTILYLKFLRQLPVLLWYSDWSCLNSCYRFKSKKAKSKDTFSP